MSDATKQLALQRALYVSRNPTRRYLHCARRDWIAARLGRAAPQATALEIGPGCGLYLPMLAQSAERVIAVDRDSTYLVAARAGVTTAVGYVQADLKAMPLAPGSVDLMLCSEVLEHIEDSAPLLSSMAALLRPGGRLILTTPQPLSPLEILGKVAFLPLVIDLLRWIYREPIEPTGHSNLLWPRELAKQFAQAGLVVEECTQLGMYLPVLAEFGGTSGQRMLAGLERLLRPTPLRCLLWTQCYVLRRREDDSC